MEVALRADVDSAELLSLLPEGEALGSWEMDGIIHIYWNEEQWRPALLEDLKRALARLGIEDRDVRLSANSVPDEDWNAAWVASLQPIRIGRQIRIRQSWHPADTSFKGIELIVDPKRAFGSGYHATTQLVLEWLEENIKPGDRVLDIGTGSGILAMTAIRLGAASALGIDNDPVALECAGEMSAANGIGPQLELRVASLEDADFGLFDIVVANLDGRTLPRLCGLLPAMLKTGGKACLSGLQEENYEEIAAAAAKADLAVTLRMTREDWLALEVRPGQGLRPHPTFVQRSSC